MILKLIETFLLGAFFLTAFGGHIDVLYNVKNGKSTKPSVWIIPSILLVCFWIVHNKIHL